MKLSELGKHTPGPANSNRLHDNAPADLLSVPCNSAQMHWCPRVGDNFCHTTHLLGNSDHFVSAMVISWHPTGATLVEGRCGTLSCNPTQVDLTYSRLRNREPGGVLNFCICGIPPWDRMREMLPVGFFRTEGSSMDWSESWCIYAKCSMLIDL